MDFLFRIEYWANGWHCDQDQKQLTRRELDAMQPHMAKWTSPWRVINNSTNEIVAQSKKQPKENGNPADGTDSPQH